MTGFVVAQTLPEGGYADAEMREALAGASSSAPAIPLEDQVGALPFRLSDRAGFRPVRVMTGNSLLLTDGPQDVVRDAEQPILIVAQSLQPAPRDPEARNAFARAAILSNNGIRDLAFERGGPFRQGGAEWHEIVARGRRRRARTSRWWSCRRSASAPAPTCASSASRAPRPATPRCRAFARWWTGSRWSEDRSRSPPCGGENGQAPFGAASAVSAAPFAAPGRRLRAALGDAHESRAQDPLADHVARLHDLHHRAVRHVGVRHLEHGLVEVRVEALPVRVEPLDAVTLERLEQVALRQLDALDQGQERPLRPLPRLRPARSPAPGARCRRPSACRARSSSPRRGARPRPHAPCGGAGSPCRRACAGAFRAGRCARPRGARRRPAAGSPATASVSGRHGVVGRGRVQAKGVGFRVVRHGSRQSCLGVRT